MLVEHCTLDRLNTTGVCIYMGYFFLALLVVGIFLTVVLTAVHSILLEFTMGVFFFPSLYSLL